MTVVDQCNDATNGGGGTLRCSVEVTNDHVGLSPTITAATVNQCVGSGDGFTVGATPPPTDTSPAAVAGESPPTSLAWVLLLLGMFATGLAVAARRVSRRS